MGIKLKSLLESNPHLQKPKADEPEKTGEMPTSYEIVWLEENDEGIIEEKGKTFKSKESFEEFCCELEENPNFIQINKKIEPSKVESVDQPSTDYKEIKESLILGGNVHMLKENYKRFFGGLGLGFQNKNVRSYLSENSNTAIDTINHNGQNLTLHKIGDNPMKIQFHLEDENGEPYLDLSTILPDNLLDGAVWVKSGDIEEEIADTLDILSKTDRTTKGGYNTYIMYNIIG